MFHGVCAGAFFCVAQSNTSGTPGTRLCSAGSCFLSVNLLHSDFCVVGGELLYNLQWLGPLSFRPFIFELVASANMCMSAGFSGMIH